MTVELALAFLFLFVVCLLLVNWDWMFRSEGRSGVALFQMIHQSLMVKHSLQPDHLPFGVAGTRWDLGCIIAKLIEFWVIALDQCQS